MLWMAASGVLFWVLNTLLKQLSHEMEPWLAAFLRYLVGTLIVSGFLLRRGLRGLWPRRPGLQFARGGLHAIGTMFWFAAVPGISLAELTAIAFSLPIWICIGAVLFLGERMTAARWTAVVVGFAGVLLVADPFGPGGVAIAGARAQDDAAVAMDDVEDFGGGATDPLGWGGEGQVGAAFDRPPAGVYRGGGAVDRVGE